MTALDECVPETLPFGDTTIAIQKLSPLNNRQSILIGMIAFFATAIAWPQTYPSFPGAATDNKTLRTQERVEELFVSGSLDRAYIIYRNELAPLGDKYAQYMVGYMHLTGGGVSEDPAVALAWYRLAAERGDPSISQVRDELQESLSPTQVVTADELFAKLKAEMSDQVLIYRLVQQDLALLRDRFGRSKAMSASPVLIIDRRYGYMSGAQYYQIVKKRLSVRLNYLKSQVEIVDMEGPKTMELAQIESDIKELTAEIDAKQ